MAGQGGGLGTSGSSQDLTGVAEQAERPGLLRVAEQGGVSLVAHW